MACDKSKKKTLCEKVSQRQFDLWVNSDKVIFKKCGKYVKLILSGIRGITLYQVYNEFNKKLNCNREVIRLKPENYESTLNQYKERTCFMEFISCEDKHISFAYNLGKTSYNAELNELVIRKNVIDKLFVEGVLVDNYKYYKGRNVCCSIDSAVIWKCPSNCTSRQAAGEFTCQTINSNFVTTANNGGFPNCNES